MSDAQTVTPGWYIACEARRLGRGPRPFRLQGVPWVLFRDAEGRPSGVLDRCPHRGVPLSLGKVRQGRLACAYHGWEFDGRGRCTFVPALGAGGRPPKGACVRTLPLIERQGWIWAWQGEAAGGDPPPMDPPPEVPGHGWPGWGHVRFSRILAARVDEVIENFIDCPHTGYVHGGLFRTPADHEAVHHVRQDVSGVHVDIDEEVRPRSLLGRILVRAGARVAHRDRFLPPATVEVRYRFGEQWEVVGRQTCTPVDAWTTAVHVDVAWRLAPLTPLVGPLVAVVGRVVLAQDVRILERQAENLQLFGAHFCSTDADLTNLWIQGWLRRWRSGRPQVASHAKTVRFRL
ncbi:MAG: aromatic ring-hydroxylating dioxygenase subunit alpha [Candidatus Sericytochromatia bacterium]|nr:aromatic ring-hydroxylating dioxygenase subunit alpha [Candidatus Sericytochromatia bacterium]